MYVVEFQSLQHPALYSPRMLQSHNRSHGLVQLYHITDLDPRFPLYGAAVLVFMSHFKSDSPAKTSTYLAKYHREAQKCIDNASLLELVYASYVVAIYSLIQGESIQMAFKYCHQFCQSVVRLARQSKGLDDWIELVWRGVFIALYHVHRDTIFFHYPRTVAPLTESVALWEAILETSYGLLVSDHDISKLPLSMTTERICHKIQSLSVFMQIYLDQFLNRVNGAENARETKLAKDRLYSILDRIIRLVERLSNIADYLHHAYNMEQNASVSEFMRFAPLQPRGLKDVSAPYTRDTVLALLYAFARLLKNLLEPDADIDENVRSEINSSAIAICKLCTNIPIGSMRDTLIVKRSLFWAGLILTETKLSPGQIPFCTSFNSYSIFMDQRSST